MASLRADRRLYETPNKDAICEEGDIRGRWLIAGIGSTIGASDVKKYGLSMKGGRVRYDGAPDLEDLPEVKEASKPEDKEATKAEDKEASKPEDKVMSFGGDTNTGDTSATLPEPDDAEGEPDDAEKEPDVAVWTRKSSPEAYLKRYPKGPSAGLARDVIAAREAAGE